MTETAPLAEREPRWAMVPERVTAWREWAGEMVVYDDVSGDTLKLDPMMTLIVDRLKQAPARPAELVAHLAELLEVDNDPKLRQLTQLGLDRLAASGLVAAAEAPDPVAQSRP